MQQRLAKPYENQPELASFLVANPKFKGWPDIVQLRAYYIPKKGKP